MRRRNQFGIVTRRFAARRIRRGNVDQSHVRERDVERSIGLDGERHAHIAQIGAWKAAQRQGERVPVAGIRTQRRGEVTHRSMIEPASTCAATGALRRCTVGRTAAYAHPHEASGSRIHAVGELQRDIRVKRIG